MRSASLSALDSGGTTDGHPSVAVIMPNHWRTGETLAAIDSVRRQDYPGKVLIYLVYQPRANVESLLRDLPPGVHALPLSPSFEVNPIAARRNVGLAAGTEDLVAFMDDDDLWHPGKLSAQIEALRSHRTAVAVCTAFDAFETTPAWTDSREPARVVQRSEVLTARTIATSSMVVRRDAIPDLRFDDRPNWTAVEDFDLWIRLERKGPILFVPRTLTGIRVAAGSPSRANRALVHARGLDVLAAHAHDQRRALLIPAADRVMRVALSDGTFDRPVETTVMTALDGRLFGRADPLVASAVRLARRSRRVAPAVRAVRRRIRSRLGKPS